MRITAEVISVGQKIDVATATAIHTMELMLPDGSTLSATIGEGDAEKLMYLCAGAEPPDRATEPSPPPSARHVDVVRQDDEVRVFGGDGGDWASHSMAEPVPPPSPAPRRRAQLVGRDEAGNPLVAGAPDPMQEPLEDTGVDEDGAIAG